MNNYILYTNNYKETIMIGNKISKKLKKGYIINVKGKLGVGKTQFAKGVALGLNINSIVNSPTFIIMNIYNSNNNNIFYHIDAYRIKTLDEGIELGLQEAFNGDGITLVEWGEVIYDLYKGNIIDVNIIKINNNKRKIIIKGDFNGIFRNRKFK